MLMLIVLLEDKKRFSDLPHVFL